MRFHSGLAMVTAILSCLARPALAAPGPLDGVYRGEASSTGGLCHSFTAVLRVTEGAATFKLDAMTTFEGTVTGNGTLDTALRTTTLTGRIADGVFRGNVNGVKCHYELVLPRQ